ncbi:small subunit ribosomal protein S13e [Nematocida parisii]|uniref:40S ribosomal protein S13 n=1 Tax=Nematocida parisii (strain ERTm3) TaxID=935791 RepID=I3EIW8_NEMP3|nr:40S ribosomal protein S13 [Nematocida parisii ERTm1]EIJ89165.1 40S ribosomal protein S13 [Nematocida parisii ERTm3]KAI5126369.1 small subunit ribosomal protein S13e [Nematocida parisii]EIJ93285.1 40S ribosomal protein S13 [Nematocida parisii ERTm1]KAI5126448.1 small subunit ribosomal protein S13e [Nematocida parisii]KAI5140727.1 small subunit ribosomal protein S13e [Nematocida parisii]|eukprot:XP_013059455.1 40S ribosomal protein S13 [Nematocida parisii ERTm1]
MGRMHNQGKGISGSTTPYVRESPEWLDANIDEIEGKIIAYAKKGLTLSQIGTILRDEYHIGNMKFFSGRKLLMILMKNNLAPQVPEDLAALVKKAISIRKHLESNTRDTDSKYRLILVESRISRLARYYKTRKVIPANWTPPYRSAVKRNSGL